MAFFSYGKIKISAISAAVPTEKVLVDSFGQQNGYDNVEKFKSKIGIKEFRRTKLHQTASDLGCVAAEKILNEKDIDRQTIGALVFVAHSVDYRRPATACVLHKRLKLSVDCAAFDVNLGCSAITYGLEIVCSMMTNSSMERALLVVGETMTKMVNPNDKSVNMMFGDAGAAILLEKDNDSKDTIDILLKTDGKGYRTIIAPAGGFRNMDASHDERIWSDGNIRSLYNIFMNGTDVFAFSVFDVVDTVKQFFAETNTSPEDYECFAFHQSNLYMLKQMCKKTGIPFEKMPICLDRFGNTSAASVALALCDSYGADKCGKMRTLLCCFGVGLSWGVASISIEKNNIFPITESDEIFEEGYISEPM